MWSSLHRTAGRDAGARVPQREVPIRAARYVTRTVRGSKRDAGTACAQLVAEASRGVYSERSSGTVAELVERWMEHITADASPATLASYRVYLRRWIMPALGEVKLNIDPPTWLVSSPQPSNGTPSWRCTCGSPR